MLFLKNAKYDRIFGKVDRLKNFYRRLKKLSFWAFGVTLRAVITMGIDQQKENYTQILVYPNPSNGSIITMEFQAPTNTQTQIIITDMMGRTVYSNDLKDRNDINSVYSLDVSNLSSGIYMVNLVVNKVKVCQKLIKN